MELSMNNTDVQSILDECQADLDQVKTIVDGLGIGSNIVPYLSRYSIIRACGAIETSFKSIIADFCSYRSKKQVKTFIDSRVRGISSNPSYSNICKLLKAFDNDWHSQFKIQIDAHPRKGNLMTSLQSLVDARNDFAHGGHPSLSLSDLITYFADSREVIEVLDRIIN